MTPTHSPLSCIAAALALVIVVDEPAIAAEVLTAAEVARRAEATNFEVRARAEDRAAADAAVDQARAAFYPRLSGTARYTRLSNTNVPPLGNVVLAPRDTPVGSHPDPATLIAAPIAFPTLVDQYAAQATLQIPLSEYLLRLPHAVAVAKANARAAAFDEAAELRAVGLNARIAYYTWARARLQVEMVQHAVDEARRRLADAGVTSAADAAPSADVGRIQALIAAAKSYLMRTGNLAALAEQQLHTLMHDPAGQPYEVGETIDLDALADVPAPAPADPPLDSLFAEAESQRAELRALATGTAAAHEQAAAFRAMALPRLDAIGNVVYANPNLRVLPQTAKYRETWDATIQLSWTPTDLPGALASRRAALARAAGLDARRAALADAIRMQVAQAAMSVHEAQAAGAAARRRIAAAVESARLRHLLYLDKRATAVELIDAETEVTRARLDLLGAETDLRVAQARLDHALGRTADARDD